MKKIILIFTLAFLCLSFSANADIYEVHNIHVDITAENATKAKEQGIADAQEKAFYKLLNRLTLVKDLDSLPVLSTEDILNLVRDFSVANEKTSSVRYIADVDVQFDPETVQKFFQDNRVPYVNASSEKSLIFPVYKNTNSEEILLWKDNNPWSKALSKAAASTDLVPLVVPIGDIDDMQIINEENFANEDNLKITPLLQRYNCKNALVAELTVSEKNNTVQVVVRPFQNKQTDLNITDITEPIDAPMIQVLMRTADRVVYLLEQSWREKSAVRFDAPAQINANVYIKDLAEWLKIRKQLDNISLIKQYIVKSLRPDNAEIEIFYVSDLTGLNEALKKENLFLIETQNGFVIKNLSDITEDQLNIEKNDILDEQNLIIERQNSPEEELSAQTSNDVIDGEMIDYHSEIRTFGQDLYDQIQPETMDMFKQIKKGE